MTSLLQSFKTGKFFLATVMLSVLCFGGSQLAVGQISITNNGVALTQDFNTLALSGTTNTAVPSGWLFAESGTGANSTYAAGTGSDNGGNTYSFGAASNSERAFGGLLSGSVTPTIGVRFTNNTGSTISSLDISYIGEQWRLGATGRFDRLDFQYSLDATSLTTGSWTDFNALDFIAPNSTGTVGAFNGNATANRTTVSSTITGLSIANGASFTLRWNDFNASGSDDGLAIDDFSITTAALQTVPDAPTIGTATIAANSQTATVPFTAPGSDGGSAITSYTATSNPGGLTGTLNQAGSGSIEVAGLTYGTAYTFTVTATNGIGESDPSAASNSITPFTVPDAPEIGTAVAGNGQATIPFTAPAFDGGSVITSYTATSNPGGFTGTVNQAGSGSIVVTGLSNGTAYTFTVTATNAAGTGAASAASNSVTPTAGAVAPDAPVIGAATAGNGEATVAFTAPASDGGSTILSYTATSNPGGLTGTVNQSGSGSIVVTGLTNGVEYTFTVTATNAIGTSVPSGASNSVTPATVPDAPVIGTATPGNGEATVSFTAPAFDGGSAITSYTATSNPGGFTGTVNQSGSGSIVVTGLTNGTPYTFTVTATNAVGTSAASAASNSTTPASVPDAPVIGTATAGNAEATVSFTAPASDGGSVITSYTATSTPGGLTGTVNQSGSGSIVVTGLTNGIEYSFTVTATNAIGTSAASAASNTVTPRTVPGAPVIGTAVTGDAQATVSYTAPASNGGAAITSYTATSTPGGFTGTVNQAGSGSIVVTGLTNGVSYTFTVTATNAAGTSAASAASNSVIPKAVILTFENEGLAGDEVSAASNFNNANIGASTLTRGAGLTAATNADRFNATSWAVTSIANAVSGNDYMQFTITPNSGFQFDVEAIIFNIQRSGTGLSQIALRSSADGYATNLDGVKIVVDNTSTQTFTFTFAQSGLTSAVTYRLYGFAEQTGGTGGIGDGAGNDIIVQGTVTAILTAPGAPTIGTATIAANSQTATVPFTAPGSDGGSAITSYTATSNPGGLTGTLNQAGSGSIEVAGLTYGTAYTFTVTATNGIGESDPSAASNSITPFTVPDAPEIGTAVAGNGQATIPFTAPAFDGGSVITSYTATSNPGGFTGTVNQAGSGSIVVTGLSNGTAYTFTVTATNAAGTGAASAASNSVTPTAGAVAPDAPVIGAATAGNGEATVAFTAPASDGGSTILSYTATSNPGGITGTVNQSGSGSIVVTGLTNGVEYTFTVTATNAIGTSVPSDASNSVTPATVPDAPVIGTATPGNGEATVSFTAPAFDGGSAITSYTATANPGGFTGTVNQSGSGSIVVTGLTNGTPYTFTVTATNAVGTSAASAASNSTTPASVPGAPVIGTATAGNAEATVSFTAPASDGGSVITSYTATSTPGGLTGTVNQAGSGSIVVTGLTNGTAYTFTVTATNAIGTSADSDPSNSVTPITVPGAPVIGAAVPGAGQATVSFTAPASDGGSVITSYTATSNPGGLTGTVNQAGSGSIVVTGLTNGTAYTFTVTATNEAGTGAASAASNSVTPGEIILSFENEGLAGNEASVASNFNNTNLTASTLTRGAGLTAATNADRFNATNWAVTSITNAVTGNDYMEFTITPNSGAQFVVSAMIFNIQRSATGLSQIALRSSADGYTTNLDGIKTVVDNTSTQTFTFLFTQGNSPSPVTYRLYGYSEAGGGTGGIGDGAGNDLIVLGTAISDCVPGNWIGGTGNWNNAANWSCNVVPAPTDAITISSGNVTLDTDFDVQGSLVLSGTGTLTVDPTRTLTVSGTANFNGRPVTFKSTAAGTASLGQVTGSVTGASNVTVERYIPNNGFRSWRLLSVPVTGTQTIRQAWQEGTANPLPQQNNLPNYGTQITSTGPLAAAQAAGFDNVTLSAALLRWNGSAWTGITSTNAEIDNFPAYFLFIRGERSKGITGANNNTSATTLRTTGTIYTGDQEIGVNTAFALVPNYYPSAINFTALDRTGGVNNVFYIWDSKKQSGSSLGVYQTFSGTANFVPTIAGGSYSTTLPNTTIESGQAFFVTSGAAGTITLKESAKISGTNGSLGFRPSATPAKINSRLYSGDDMLDGNVVVFDAAYDRAVDGDDAPKMGNPGANFAIETQNKILAVEGTQQPVHNEAVQFRMWNLQQQAYKLEFAASNITMPGLSAELEDSYLDTRTAIDLSGTTTVNFTVDANEASKAANRFRIVFKQAAPLPVTFISISANRTAAGVKVNWKVAEERNIASYEIERSADGRSFASVGSVAAANAAGYNFTDLNTLSSSAYYRVKSVGTAGAVSYTAIVKVAAGDSKPGYSISPNPAEGTIVNLQIKNQPQGNYSVRLLNNVGQLLYSNKLVHAGGNSTQQIKLPAGLIRGVYQVDVIAPDRTKTSQKLLINTNL